MVTSLPVAKKTARVIPFPFVLEELADLNPRTNPMFGCEAVYVGEKIVFVLRERDSSPRDNGLWLATTAEHHGALKKIFPTMRSIEIFGTGVTGWQVLPADARGFEEAALKACALVRQRSPLIGKVPAAKKVKKSAKAKTKASAPASPRRGRRSRTA